MKYGGVAQWQEREAAVARASTIRPAVAVVDTRMRGFDSRRPTQRRQSKEAGTGRGLAVKGAAMSVPSGRRLPTS